MTALADKGETPGEIAVFASELRDKALPVPLDDETRGREMLDVCGTGGDKLGTFNISTTVALVAAAAGAATTGLPMVCTLTFDAAGRTKNKTFTDKRVRKALMMAVDRESLVKNVIAGGSEVRTIDTPCFPVQQGCAWTTKPVAYDPVGAKKLLAEAGFPNGLDFTLSSFSGAHQVSEAVAGQWRKIGVRAKLFRMTFGSYRKRQRDNKQVALLGRYSSGGLPDASAITDFYFGGTARDYYHDKVLDGLRLKVKSTMDVNKRKEFFRQAMDRMNNEHIIFPIATNPAVFVHTAEVKMKKGSLSNYGVEPTDLSWN